MNTTQSSKVVMVYAYKDNMAVWSYGVKIMYILYEIMYEKFLYSAFTNLNAYKRNTHGEKDNVDLKDLNWNFIIIHTNENIKINRRKQDRVCTWENKIIVLPYVMILYAGNM